MTALVRVLTGRIHLPHRRHHPALTPVDEIIPTGPALHIRTTVVSPGVWVPPTRVNQVTLPLPNVPMRAPARVVAPHRTLDEIDEVNTRLEARLDVVAALHECIAVRPGGLGRLATALGHALATHAMPYTTCVYVMRLGVL
jgi:hypothetical protein